MKETVQHAQYNTKLNKEKHLLTTCHVTSFDGR